MSNEEHGQEFLKFVADNESRLKNNLRKNITYDENIFDDVFQETILRVHSAIMNGTRIDDFEQYFFIASKFCYINEQNKERKKQENSDRDILWNISHGYETNQHDVSNDAKRILENITIEDNEWRIQEERNDKINELMKYLSKKLNEVFTPAETDIFLIYYRLKSEKAGVSYQKMARITEKSFSEVSQIIQKIKAYIKQDEEINEYKKKLLK
jgi:RNA polymerase sigma factor (sigma-70 family)